MRRSLQCGGLLPLPARLFERPERITGLDMNRAEYGLDGSSEIIVLPVKHILEQMQSVCIQEIMENNGVIEWLGAEFAILAAAEIELPKLLLAVIEETLAFIQRRAGAVERSQLFDERIEEI